MKSKGIFETKRKDNSTYYRVSIYVNKKHISLGSFDIFEDAVTCYDSANKILDDADHLFTPDNYDSELKISFEKYIVLINYRDNKLYIANPIYLKPNFFEYYITKDTILKFDKDDLFYYSDKKISKRGNHYYCHEFGLQININDRYGIPPYAVIGRDYIFKNGDTTDYRYSNIEIVNKYHGVSKVNKKGKIVYEVKVHVNGYLKVGDFKDEITAAIAYNKACDILSKNADKGFISNYPDINPKEYATIYSEIQIPRKFYDL